MSETKSQKLFHATAPVLEPQVVGGPHEVFYHGYGKTPELALKDLKETLVYMHVTPIGKAKVGRHRT